MRTKSVFTRVMAAFMVVFALAVCGNSDNAHAATKAQSVGFLLSQVRNASGSLAGGKVYFYEAGTSTLKNVWLDRGKQTPAANPYTLDSNGTAAVFCDGIYRIVIKTSALVTVYDRDYISIKEVAGNVYDVADYASLAAAVASIGSTPATLEYGTDQTLAANLTIPATLKLRPVNGAIINHAAYTVTFTDPDTAGWSDAQMFNGTGVVTGFKVGNPRWLGAKPDGTTESSSAINRMITGATKTVVGPGDWRCDNPILPKTSGTLVINGALKRLSAYSASTRPVLIINSQASTVTSDGGGSIISQNASPDGVALFGVEDPASLPAQINIEWCRLEKLTISGVKAAGNLGVCAQGVAGWGGAEIIYQNWIENLVINSVDTGIYFGAQSNANIISNIHFWNIESKSMWFAGDDGSGTYPTHKSITDNIVHGIFTHASPDLTHTLFLVNSSWNSFSAIHGEPTSGGTAMLYQLDANSESNNISGVDNHPISSIDAGRRNSIRTNIIDRNVNANFSAYKSATAANVTGDGTSYAPVCDTEVWDKTGDHNPATGLFTATAAGKYRFSGVLYLTGLGAAHTTIVVHLRTTTRIWAVYAEVVTTQGKTSFGIPWVSVADLAVGEQAWLTVAVSGSTKTVNVFGTTAPTTWFAGELLP